VTALDAITGGLQRAREPAPSGRRMRPLIELRAVGKSYQGGTVALSISRSAMASSSACSARRAAASRPCCA
jgi:hypothetical protein